MKLFLFFVLGIADIGGISAQQRYSESFTLDSLRKIIFNKEIDTKKRKESLILYKSLSLKESAQYIEKQKEMYEARPQQLLLKEVEKNVKAMEYQKDSIVNSLIYMIDSDTAADGIDKGRAISILSKIDSRHAYRFLMKNPNVSTGHDNIFVNTYAILKEQSYDNWNLLPEVVEILNQRVEEDQIEDVADILYNIFQSKYTAIEYLIICERNRKIQFSDNVKKIIYWIELKY